MAIRIVAGIMFAALVGFIGYANFKTTPLTPKAIVEDAVNKARQAGPLSSEEEILLRLQVAVADYKSRNGQPPNSLGDLVPAYMERVPSDPETKEPFAYRRQGSMGLLGKLATATPQTAKGAAGSANGQMVEPTDEGKIVLKQLVEEKFAYNPEGRRDPFLPFNQQDLNKNQGCDPATPLRCYKLGQLRVAAILKDQNGNPIAMLEDEAGKGYSARKGTFIGEREGVVADIEPDKVKIVQSETEKYTGVVKQNVVELKLMKDTEPDQKKQRRRKPSK